jgi:hypothetical protein
MIRRLYGEQVNAADFFTSDRTRVTRVLESLEANGNEDTLLALDIAADFPFGPSESTRRVIALFTDEPLEAGISAQEPMVRMPALVEKLMARRIQLFAAAPYSEALGDLGAADRAEIEDITGGDGLASVDFRKLLAQMAKSISVSSVQAGAEPRWQRAIYGQDRWASQRFVDAQDRSVIVRSGEIGGIQVSCNRLGVLLDVSPSMTSFLPALRDEIRQHFADAEYREEYHCRLMPYGFGEGTLRHLQELVGPQQCDGVFWFSDFKDRRYESTVAELGQLLTAAGAKLYIRSIDRRPDDLIQLTTLSGGGYRNGPPSSLSE